MRKQWILLLAVLFSLCCPAFAEIYEGTTAALSTVKVRAEYGGVVKAIDGIVGQRVEAGQTLCTLDSEKAFAQQDGTVSIVYADAGDDVSGTVLEIIPRERYTIYCTVDKAYQSAESTMVHCGETVYIKCTVDGTHRGIGVITEIDGEEYHVMTVAGTFYVGETVYLYRDEDFTAKQRVGIGTLVTSDNETYDADGTVTKLKVAAGDSVERGQLLFETNGEEVTSPLSGIISAVSRSIGENVAENDDILEIIPESEVCVEIQVDEYNAGLIDMSAKAQLTFGDEDNENTVSGTILNMAWIENEGAYTVRILPETEEALPIGMTVWVELP